MHFFQIKSPPLYKFRLCTIEASNWTVIKQLVKNFLHKFYFIFMRFLPKSYIIFNYRAIGLQILFSKFCGKIGIAYLACLDIVSNFQLILNCDLGTKKLIFFTPLTCEKRPQNNLSRQNISVENNYFFCGFAWRTKCFAKINFSQNSFLNFMEIDNHWSKNVQFVK